MLITVLVLVRSFSNCAEINNTYLAKCCINVYFILSTVFNSQYMIGAEFHNVSPQSNKNDVAIKLWFNNQAYHAVAVTVNYLTNCILEYGFNNTNGSYTVTTTNHPLPPTGDETLTSIKK